MKYSIIFLVEEESEEFSPFFDLIYGVFEDQGEEFEVLVAANGTSEFVAKSMNLRKNYREGVKVIAFPAKVPQPVCLNAALCECSGALILTLSPYQELSSSSYEKIIPAMTEGVDLVAPYRKQRKDAFLNRVHSKILNRVVRWVLGAGLHDIGCNVRFFRREVLESLELFQPGGRNPCVRGSCGAVLCGVSKGGIRRAHRWVSLDRTGLHGLDVYTLGAHARRSRLLFKKVFGNGVNAGVIAAKDQSYDPERWWKSSNGARTVLSELIGYFYAVTVFRP